VQFEFVGATQTLSEQVKFVPHMLAEVAHIVPETPTAMQVLPDAELEQTPD
jgi:hypothetical protein